MARIIHLEQSGPDWHRWRAQGLGGSDACAVMGDVAWMSRDELAEVKRGKRVQEENAAMARGKALEPEARALYIEVSGNEVRPVCVQHDTLPWLRASLDGLSLDGKLAVEIKCPGEWPHFHACKGRTPRYYRAQMQHILAASGAEMLHYFSYRPEAKKKWALIEVERDEAYIEKLLAQEQRFWDELHAKPDLSRPTSD